MGKRRIFRDRQGRFTKPDRRKIFRMEIDGERTELMSWTERQLAEALAIPLEPEDEPRLFPGQARQESFTIESPSDFDTVSDIVPLGAVRAEVEITIADGRTAVFFDFFDDPEELIGRIWGLMNELGAFNTAGLNELLEDGPISVTVEFFA